MKFEVSVEKRLYATGVVIVDCDSAEEAVEEVQRRIDSGELQTSEVEWDDPQYEDLSFTTTGDVG